MHDIKQILAIAVREARTELGLSQEKLAETLNMDTRTILNIEAGRGNPKYDKLYPLITYPKILNDCTEQEAADLLPMVRYLLDLLHKQDHPTL